jgi:hypothetical protein
MDHDFNVLIVNFFCSSSVYWEIQCIHIRMVQFQKLTSTVFTSVICALFFSSLAAEKSGCVKYADFFCGGLGLGFILV